MIAIIELSLDLGDYFDNLSIQKLDTAFQILESKASRINSAWYVFAISFIINGIQGYFTPLLNDEAYYWLFSLNPALGYYDHPPLIAWLIAMGSSLFESEIGVRLFALLVGSFTPFFLYRIIEKENKGQVNTVLFLILIFSSVFINLYSFIAIPDTLLLFFTVLFFLQYRRFLLAPNTSNALLIGLICALMLYSKYHGILVIGFTILSNPNLLTRKGFYLAVVTALILFIPHILWQIENDLPTLRFHLFEKGNEFELKNILSYTGEQVLLTGPLILLLFTILKKTHNRFLFSIKFVSLGVFVFFFVSSFRGMVNAYWTLVAWPGMLVLSYMYIEKMEHGKKLVRTILIFGAVLVLIMRINFLFNIYPVPHFNNRNPKEMAKLISLKTDNEVVFVNTFIDAALYSFYSAKQSYAINNTQYKKTQYNYMFNAEERLQGKTINLISFNKHLFNCDTLNTPKGKTYYISTVENFDSYQNSLKIKATPPKKLKAGEKLLLPIELKKSVAVENTKNPEDVYLIFTFYNKQKAQAFSSYRYYEKFPDVLEPFEIIAPERAGKYKTHFSISSDTSMIFRTYNSKVWFIELEIIRDVQSSVTLPAKELKAFRKAQPKPEGFNVMFGNSSDDKNLTKLQLVIE